MARKATTNRPNRVRVQVCLPADLYDRFKEHAAESLLSESTAGSLLIQQALDAATTTACGNNTQASA
ncbi:MAG: hypothetical protein VX474_02735 [Pseudomonadota bacterium]|nr:hypothetical protein [Pseudomonadota bacterium]